MTNEDAMTIALGEAALAIEHGDVPVGAVVLVDGQVVSKRHNERELTGDPTAHAEVLAIRDATAITGSWRLENATLVVTLEPCVMCAGAIVAARMETLVMGTRDVKAGACGSLYNVLSDPRLNHETKIETSVKTNEAAELLRQFFNQRR